MGVLGTLRTGLRLTRDSVHVLREYPNLLLFPLGGIGVTLLLVVGSFLADLVLTQYGYVTVFLLYLLVTYVGSFFAAGLVYSVNDAFHGRTPSLSSGLAAAWQKKRPLLIWSLLAATVGVIIQRLQHNRSPLGAQIAARLFQFGWAVTTFFIIPVIVFEDVGIRETFEKSATTFRKTWGETLGSGLGIGFVQLVIVVGGLILVIILNILLGAVGAPGLFSFVFFLGGGIVVVLGAIVIGQTVRAITKTALYVFAADGRKPKEFADFDFETLGERTDRNATPGEAELSTKPSE